MKVGLITISDRVSMGLYEDLSTPILEKWMLDHRVISLTKHLIPDDVNQLLNIFHILLEQNLDLILTCGGTGLAPRDITPDVTKKIIEKEVPGIPELIRSKNTHPMSALSRAICGFYKKTLILNLSGKPQGALEQLETAWPVILHACKVLKGKGVPNDYCG